MKKIYFILLTSLLIMACKTPAPVAEAVQPVVHVVKLEPLPIPEPAPVPVFEPVPVPEVIIPVIDILEPEFSIISIHILKADLVVTEFETVLRVDNPNEFEVEFSSIIYELYGNGAFWADGIGNDILYVPALSSSETKFIFKMNFIDMNRRLLDDVIALKPIDYRFKGQAHVQPDLPDYPAFIANFDCSGLSQVRPR
ncbi:MAG: LEA type 2 family protein [Treponema sp.]|nr:LEA type 2 family protein [Treponema sp.]